MQGRAADVPVVLPRIRNKHSLRSAEEPPLLCAQPSALPFLGGLLGPAAPPHR